MRAITMNGARGQDPVLISGAINCALITSGLSRYGLKPILALEWQCPEKMRGQPLIFMLVPANAGVEAGLTVLGIVQYD